MARYYYDRYNIITETAYEWHRHNVVSTTQYVTSGWSYGQPDYEKTSISGYPDYSFNSSTGIFTNVGKLTSINIGARSGTLYRASGRSITQEYIMDDGAFYYAMVNSVMYSDLSTVYSRGAFIETVTGSYSAYTNNARNADGYWYMRGDQVTLQKRGTYVDTIIAENDTYPADGIFDGYWYVRGKRAFPDFKVKYSGQLGSAVDGWVRTNGQLKQIQQMWVRVNGQLKEV